MMNIINEPFLIESEIALRELLSERGEDCVVDAEACKWDLRFVATSHDNITMMSQYYPCQGEDYESWLTEQADLLASLIQTRRKWLKEHD